MLSANKIVLHNSERGKGGGPVGPYLGQSLEFVFLMGEILMLRSLQFELGPRNLYNIYGLNFVLIWVLNKQK